MADEDLAIGLLCLDVDGTLVDCHGRLYPGATELVDFGRQRCEVALCSARPISSLELVSTMLGGVEFLVGLQGAIAIAPPNAEALWSIELDAEDLSELKSVALHMGLELWCYDVHRWICGAATSAVEREAAIIGVEPIIAALRPGAMCKVALVDRAPGGERKLLDVAYQMRHSSLMCSLSHPYMLEVVSKSVGVEKGLGRLKATRGAACGAIVSVGDSENDVGLLSASDRSFSFVDCAPAGLVGGVNIVASPGEGGLFQILALLHRLFPRRNEDESRLAEGCVPPARAALEG